MSILPRLEMKQSQSLILTTKMQLALKLLQLSNIELEAYILEELDQNPILEKEETITELDNEGTADHEPSETPEAALDENASGDGQLDLSEQVPLDTDYDNQWQDDQNSSFGSSHTSSNHGTSGEHENYIDQIPQKEKSLQEHLQEQVNIDILEPKDRFIASRLIDHMTESGYILEPLQNIADALHCPLEWVEAVLLKMQQFDPIGIMARNLQECLSLQLKDKDLYTEKYQLLLDHLDLFADHKFDLLMEKCDVTRDELKSMILEIQKLNPKPGHQYSSEMIEVMIPDVYVRRHSDGTYFIELNNETLPRLLINDKYLSKVQSQAKSSKEKDYLIQKLNTAHWLMSALQQRATSILKVATEIVKTQRDFLDKGIEHLKPMTMYDVATTLEINESTVSRITMNKYISTPKGLFALKDFFTRSVTNAEADSDESHSTETVKYLVKKFIEAEKPDHILQDDQIVELLKERGMVVARRTIAKYRKILNIPSSLERKKFKNSEIL